MEYTPAEIAMAQRLYNEIGPSLCELKCYAAQHKATMGWYFQFEGDTTAGRRYILTYSPKENRLTLGLAQDSGALVEEELPKIQASILAQYREFADSTREAINLVIARHACEDEMGKVLTNRYAEKIEALRKTLKPNQQDELGVSGVKLPYWCSKERGDIHVDFRFFEVPVGDDFKEARLEEFDRIFENAEFVELKGVTNIEGLVGETIVDVQYDDDTFSMLLESGRIFRLYHYQECCEHVVLTDIDGDVNDLIGGVCNHAEIVFDGDSDLKWTFYRFGTNKGSVTLRWEGSSNGYYSVDVNYKWTDSTEIPVCRGKFALSLSRNKHD